MNDELAAVDVAWNMSGATDFKGNAWPDRKGLMNLIMRYEDSEWLILVMHNMDLPAMPIPDFKKTNVNTAQVLS